MTDPITGSVTIVFTGSTPENRAAGKALVERCGRAELPSDFAFFAGPQKSFTVSLAHPPRIGTVLHAHLWRGKCELGHEVAVYDIEESTYEVGIPCPVCNPEVTEPEPPVERVPLSAQTKRSLRILFWQWAEHHLDDPGERGREAWDIYMRMKDSFHVEK